MSEHKTGHTHLGISVATGIRVAPALWNPNAAFLWSLLFRPVFGAYLHLQNWKVLGRADKAAVAKRWVIMCAVVVALATTVGLVLAGSETTDGVLRSMSYALILVWYFGTGRSQAAYVAENFGKTYPRRRWLKPILAALGFMTALVVVSGIAGLTPQ